MAISLKNICVHLADVDDIFCCCAWPIAILWNRLKIKRLRRSIITKFRYMFTLGIVTSFCLLMLSKQSWLILNDKVCLRIGYRNCEMLHGPAPVYRVLFILSIYFFLMAIFTIGVDSSQEIRALFHNYFWTSRSVFLSIILIASIFLPRTVYAGEVWHFFGLNAAFAFIVLQFVILLDAAHELNTITVNWIEKSEETNCCAKFYFLILWVPTVFLYGITIYGTAIFYKLYGSRKDCLSNLFFISFHVYMCVSATFISIHPIVLEARPKSGLFQSSVVTSYSTYILWLTLSNQPDDACNPNREYIYPIDPLANKQIALSLLITAICLTAFSVRVVNAPQYGKYLAIPGTNFQNESTSTTEDHINSEEMVESQRRSRFRFPTILRDDEIEGVEYSYSFYHLILSIASMYLMMTLTNWYRPEEEENLTVKLVAGWGAIWIKLCSGIFCVFLYIWTLVAPVIFPQSYTSLVFYELLFKT